MSSDDSNSAEVNAAIDALLQLCTTPVGSDGSEAAEAALVKALQSLRNLCADGAKNQEMVVAHDELNSFIHSMLFEARVNGASWRLRTMSWQLLANAIVNNTNTMGTVWKRYGEAIMRQCPEPPLGRNTDIQLMMVYNVLIATGEDGAKNITELQALTTMVRVWQTCVDENKDPKFEYLDMLFEYFLVKPEKEREGTDPRTTVRCYAQLPNAKDQIAFLDYLSTYLRQGNPNGIVHSFMLQHLAKEFKLKSDCVLRQATQTTEAAAVTQQDPMHPRLVYSLLRVLACASGSEQYAALLATDHALFLNVSSLLRCLSAAGKEAKPNMYTPLNKLEQVALMSDASRDFEHDVSFEMRTLLVRCIANLLYKNPKNQGYCLDTELMPVLFECTNMDARNPLMKEWSILAIRNACIGCPEIQKVVASLTEQGVVKNDIVNELNLEMGSLRIKPNGKQV